MAVETIWSDKVDEILCIGRFLGPYGSRNWALTKPQALVALMELEAEDIAVLGGEVWAEKNGEIGMNYDSWCCDRDAGETNESFVSRSIRSSREYISRYPESAEHQIYFTIVPAE